MSCIKKQYQSVSMDEITKNYIKLERAEFVSRLMIDSDLSEKNVKIGLCLLHELLYKMIMNTNNNNNNNDGGAQPCYDAA